MRKQIKYIIFLLTIISFCSISRYARSYKQQPPSPQDLQRFIAHCKAELESNSLIKYGIADLALLIQYAGTMKKESVLRKQIFLLCQKALVRTNNKFPKEHDEIKILLRNALHTFSPGPDQIKIMSLLEDYAPEKNNTFEQTENLQKENQDEPSILQEKPSKCVKKNKTEEVTPKLKKTTQVIPKTEWGKISLKKQKALKQDEKNEANKEDSQNALAIKSYPTKTETKNAGKKKKESSKKLIEAPAQSSFLGSTTDKTLSIQEGIIGACQNGELQLLLPFGD